MATRKIPPGGPGAADAAGDVGGRCDLPAAEPGDPPGDQAARTSRLRWQRDPWLDPQLVWRGKDEQDGEDLAVDAPPVYVQETVVPQVVIENLRRAGEQPEPTLFPGFGSPAGFGAVEYHQHGGGWSNRMILGDSLQVMASLAETGNLRGKVQAIYVDPPYGIKFGSNWQVVTGDREVPDGRAEGTTREVEQIKAFRDTWEKGIHSYLSYLRDRLTVARDLLTESGSVFVQIGDENAHLARCLLDETFGSENFVSQIAFKKTGGQSSSELASVTDYILWYAKARSEVKYRRLFFPKNPGEEGARQYNWVETPDGVRRPLGPSERAGELPRGARVFQPYPLVSMGRAASPEPFVWQGRAFHPSPGRHWSVTVAGLQRLADAGRLLAIGNTLREINYLDDYPVTPYTNLWADTQTSGFAGDRWYVVQTLPAVVERCILMTTDPGDLVVDPTCGSGTTAFVAEQWGRRWITIDTSRVALALARQRMMGAKFPCYLLADSAAGRARESRISGRPPASGPDSGDVRKGFVYQRVAHVTLKSIAYNPGIRAGMSREQIDAAIARHADTELLYDRPFEDKRKVRVAGRFTVESLSPYMPISPQRPAGQQAAERDAAAAFQRTILDNLLKAGVQNGRKKERLQFESLVPFPGAHVQAEGIRKDGPRGTPQRIAVSIGPRFGTVGPEWIEKAAREAALGQGFDLLLVCAFAFAPQATAAAGEPAPGAARDAAAAGGERRPAAVPVLLARMNSDLAMGDVLLKKTGSANLFMVFGEPDVVIEHTPGGVVAEIRGVDVYNPATGEIRSSGTGEIALWMIDTDYDGESFVVRHCYFTGGGDPFTRLKKALKADIDAAAWESLYSTRSRPFPRPENGKIAVKVINHYGDEVLQVYDV